MVCMRLKLLFESNLSTMYRNFFELKSWKCGGWMVLKAKYPYLFLSNNAKFYILKGHTYKETTTAEKS